MPVRGAGAYLQPCSPGLGSVRGAEGPGESNQGKRIDQPFRGVEIIPARPISIVALVGVMVVVVAFPERQQRHEPTVSTGIRLTVRLVSP